MEKMIACFGTIRNNTALKLMDSALLAYWGFGTIRNNTALKLSRNAESLARSFGTIRNNTALKLIVISLLH